MDAVPLELWTTGDDGLSQKFRDQLEVALFTDGPFIRYAGDPPPPLKLLVSDPVMPDGRGGFSVAYEISARGGPARQFKVNCPMARQDICVSQVVRDARRAIQP